MTTSPARPGISAGFLGLVAVGAAAAAPARAAVVPVGGAAPAAGAATPASMIPAAHAATARSSTAMPCPCPPQGAQQDLGGPAAGRGPPATSRWLRAEHRTGVPRSARAVHLWLADSDRLALKRLAREPPATQAMIRCTPDGWPQRDFAAPRGCVTIGGTDDQEAR